jgi:amino acid permease
MSLSYSTIAWADTASVGDRHPPDYSRPDYHLPDTTIANLVFGAFNSLGTVAFAYAGHNVVLEIQATLPSTEARPSKIAMWRGVLVAYIVVAMCYFPVALTGYWSFGNQIQGNILLSLGKPRWLIATANFFVVIHVTGSYQVSRLILQLRSSFESHVTCA